MSYRLRSSPLALTALIVVCVLLQIASLTLLGGQLGSLLDATELGAIVGGSVGIALAVWAGLRAKVTRSR